ncbi:MAG: hypothetical protein D4S01_05800 [Dehalococcoidia bacterium]|nr:MAG: hypothetical protein D4S01_05800 [Dehalococcoidia bacterium]
MVKAFKINSRKNDISSRVEKKRDKGGGFLKKKVPEELSYLRPLLFPCVFFEYQYLKKKGFMGGKSPHRSRTPFLLKPKLIWMPDLGKMVKGNELEEITEGFHLPLSQDIAERYVIAQFGIMKSMNVPGEQVRIRGGKGSMFSGTVTGSGGISMLSNAQVKQAMNLDGEPADLQNPLEISIVYLPFWVAKLESPDVTRYLVYDRDGKEDKEMTDIFNTDYDFVLRLEKEATEI